MTLPTKLCSSVELKFDFFYLLQLHLWLTILTDRWQSAQLLVRAVQGHLCRPFWLQFLPNFLLFVLIDLVKLIQGRYKVTYLSLFQ